MIKVMPNICHGLRGNYDVNYEPIISIVGPQKSTGLIVTFFREKGNPKNIYVIWASAKSAYDHTPYKISSDEGKTVEYNGMFEQWYKENNLMNFLFVKNEDMI